MEILEISLTSKDLIMQFFSTVERILKEEPDTQIFCDSIIVDEIKKRKNDKENKYYVFFKPSYSDGGYHYYSSSFEGTSDGNETLVALYKNGGYYGGERVCKVSFVRHSKSYQQIVEFDYPPNVRRYVHYEKYMNQIVFIHYKE